MRRQELWEHIKRTENEALLFEMQETLGYEKIDDAIDVVRMQIEAIPEIKKRQLLEPHRVVETCREIIQSSIDKGTFSLEKGLFEGVDKKHPAPIEFIDALKKGDLIQGLQKVENYIVTHKNSLVLGDIHRLISILTIRLGDISKQSVSFLMKFENVLEGFEYKVEDREIVNTLRAWRNILFDDEYQVKKDEIESASEVRDLWHYALLEDLSNGLGRIYEANKYNEVSLSKEDETLLHEILHYKKDEIQKGWAEKDPVVSRMEDQLFLLKEQLPFTRRKGSLHTIINTYFSPLRAKKKKKNTWGGAANEFKTGGFEESVNYGEAEQNKEDKKEVCIQEWNLFFKHLEDTKTTVISLVQEFRELMEKICSLGMVLDSFEKETISIEIIETLFHTGRFSEIVQNIKSSQKELYEVNIQKGLTILRDLYEEKIGNGEDIQAIIDFIDRKNDRA